MALAVIPDVAMEALLQLLVDEELHLHLAKSSITVDKATVLGDFDEADFGGYAVESVTWGTITINGSNQAVSVATSVAFTKTSSSPANTIFAWYLTDSADAVLYAGRTLTTPIPMSATGDELVVDLTELLGDL